MKMFPGMKMAWAVILVLFPVLPLRATIDGTPHDLVATGYGTGNPCRFCHTPHGAIAGTPLWNHQLSTAVYKIYQSSSLDAKAGQPTGSSKLCLSCHDGTVALAETVRSGGISATMPPRGTNLGTDLSDDHPISFAYSASLAAQDVQLRAPEALPGHLRLDQAQELQCSTCHNPHDNTFGKFLTMSNLRSQMCTTCHNLNGWTTSAHTNSPASSRTANDAYLSARSEYGTVADNGCLSCHRPHAAGGHERLLHFANLEDNCLNCHNGSVAHTNLNLLTSKASAHSSRHNAGIHDPRELPASAPMHVECVDCHNPHALQATPGIVPGQLSGAFRGVSGVTITGSLIPQAQNSYEICFKCHADNPGRPQSPITRKITQTNTRLEFDPANPSFHPVVTAGKNLSVPSLVPGLTITSQITCTDCHSTNNPALGRGPHGSDFAPLLAYRYETEDGTHESNLAYELCYRCHSRNSILSENRSFTKHKKHLEKGATCSACHDPHGINASQGTALNNSHLINFDMGLVSADPRTGRLEYVDRGAAHGSCTLLCHGKIHSPLSY